MLTAIAERVRSVIGGDAALDDLRAEIRKRQARRNAIESEFRKKADVSYFVEKLTVAERDYERTQADEDLERVLLAEIVLERARRRIGVAQAVISTGVVDFQFRKEFPDNRELLIKACELRLKIAEAERDRVSAEERERLKAKGFSERDIEKSLVIRRVIGAVKHLQAVLNHIKTCPVEEVWKNARELLQ